MTEALSADLVVLSCYINPQSLCHTLADAIAITSHYVDAKFIPHEDLLDFQQVSGSHTGHRLATHLLTVIHKYQIQSKLFCITTDNASNNYKMMKELSKLLLHHDGIVWNGTRNHVPCLAHVLNLAVKAFLREINVQPPAEETNWMDNRDSDNDDDSSDDDADGFHDTRTLRAKTNDFQSTIQKIRSISKAISFPPSRRQTFEAYCTATKIKPLRAVKDHAIRWNATFNMIERAVYLKPAINSWTGHKPELSNLVLTELEWELAEFLLLFLAPFKYATDMIQSTAKPSLHQTFVTYEHLFNCLDDCKLALGQMTRKPAWAPTIEAAVERMWNKLREYYSESEKPFVFIDSTILHPAKKLTFFKKQNWDTERYRDESRARFNAAYLNSAPEPSSILPAPPAKRPHSSVVSSDSDSEIEDFSEFDNYVQSKRDRNVVHPLSWWFKSQSIFPRMAVMARDVYAVPATGCGVEREFSISGRVVSKERNRLDAKTIADLMQYKRWVAHNGVVLDELVADVDAGPESEEEHREGYEWDDDEGNEDLIGWLKEWETKSTMLDRVSRWQKFM